MREFVSRLRLCLGILTAILVTGPAAAQGVLGTITHADLYARIKVAGFSAPVDVRQSGSKARMDVSTGGVLQSYIADREKGVLIAMTAAGQNRVALVFPLDHSDGVVPLPLDLSVFNAAGAQLQTIGASLVNGRSCRLMQFTGYLNQSGILCVSAENVILRMTSAGRREPLFEIVELSVARQDASWFKAPADYQVAVVPAIGGASGGGAAFSEAAAGADGAALPKVTYSKPKTQP